MFRCKNLLTMGALFGCALLITSPQGCGKGGIQPTGDGGPHSGDGIKVSPACPGGVDQDGDGYGEGCPAGTDCDDNDPSVFQGAEEICDGKDNDCNGLIDDNGLGCFHIGGKSAGGGDAPFPVDSSLDPNLMDIDGVGLDENGDLVLNRTTSENYFMWIANTTDRTRGTISKIDTRNMKEVARYYTITCHSKGLSSTCNDISGKPIDKTFTHRPSRTAVDYNFDVWVANRAHQNASGDAVSNGQPSATKIANDKLDCIDRNNNGKIDTSADLNGDGKIDLNSAEFVGDDDECVIFTVNYDEKGSFGRSLCLQPEKGLKPSTAWVGTYNRPINNFYRIDGKTGELFGPYALPAGHRVYGCAVDSQSILWSTSIREGTLVGLNTRNPTEVTKILKAPLTKETYDQHQFYGIAIGTDDHVWLGGWESRRIYRYKPDRSSFSALDAGVWTTIGAPTLLGNTRGIAPDARGFVWVAGNSGYIWRVDQNIADGSHSLQSDKNYWKTNGTTIIGVGVDFDGHVWGISNSNHRACHLPVDQLGDPKIPPGSQTTDHVTVGKNPYTYSDFTGYGLKTFTRPQGRYRYQIQPCPDGIQASWKQVLWNATVPPGTTLTVQARSGDSETTIGDWFGPYQSSPADLGAASATPLVPNPSAILQVEFVMETTDKTYSPTLHDFQVTYSCDVID